jgi:hypothetical protein
MKKFILCAFASFLAFTFIPNEVKATTGPLTESQKDSSAIRTILITRLDKIEASDKSAMSRDEKKALQKESRVIQKTLHDGYGGVYISVGALIIIILLLIILL